MCIQGVSKTVMIDSGVNVRSSEVKFPLKVHNGTGLICPVQFRRVNFSIKIYKNHGTAIKCLVLREFSLLRVRF